MSDEKYFDNVRYISTLSAAKIVNRTAGFIARTARAGKITAQREGQAWYVDEASLREFFKMPSISTVSDPFKVHRERTKERFRRTAFSAQSAIAEAVTTRPMHAGVPLFHAAHFSTSPSVTNAIHPLINFIHKVVAIVAAFLIVITAYSVVVPDDIRLALASTGESSRSALTAETIRAAIPTTVDQNLVSLSRLVADFLGNLVPPYDK